MSDDLDLERAYQRHLSTAQRREVLRALAEQIVEAIDLGDLVALRKTRSALMRESGQSLPLWGKSVDHIRWSTFMRCRNSTPTESTMKVA